MPYTIEQIRNEVSSASEECNATAPLGEKIASVSARQLCGRATGDSQIRYRPARAVYFGRRELVYLGSSAVLHGGRLGVSVDVVQDPVSDDSLLVVSKVVPLYEGH